VFLHLIARLFCVIIVYKFGKPMITSIILVALVTSNTCTKANFHQHIYALEAAAAKQEAKERDKRKQDRMTTIKKATI
jgi:hypothetical protein